MNIQTLSRSSNPTPISIAFFLSRYSYLTFGYLLISECCARIKVSEDSSQSIPMHVCGFDEFSRCGMISPVISLIPRFRTRPGITCFSFAPINSQGPQTCPTMIAVWKESLDMHSHSPTVTLAPKDPYRAIAGSSACMQSLRIERKLRDAAQCDAAKRINYSIRRE